MDVTKIVGIEVASRDDAKSVHRAIETREDEGNLEVAESSVVYKTEKGHLKHHYYGSSAFVVGTELGAITGAGIVGAGLLGLINPIIGVSMAAAIVGVGMEGGFIGHFFTHHFAGKDMLKDLGAGLDAGRGYVLIATDDAGAEFIAGDSASAGHRVATIDVTPQFVEDLAKAHEEAAEAVASE